jgi:hypothetical protein
VADERFPGSGMSARFFADPSRAVETISELLRARDWTTLSDYYDLSGAAVDPADLRSGRYFFDPEADTGHPATRGWRRPFPPGFGYDGHQDDGDRVRVDLVLRIDHGDGMVQEGHHCIWLRRSAGGYRLLPE